MFFIFIYIGRSLDALIDFHQKLDLLSVGQPEQQITQDYSIAAGTTQLTVQLLSRKEYSKAAS
jgi:hypothetical protein